jgi:hypothetical protein
MLTRPQLARPRPRPQPARPRSQPSRPRPRPRPHTPRPRPRPRSFSIICGKCEKMEMCKIPDNACRKSTCVKPVVQRAVPRESLIIKPDHLAFFSNGDYRFFVIGVPIKSVLHFCINMSMKYYSPTSLLQCCTFVCVYIVTHLR